ncbi:uncharacterized protein DNG_00934 [Cephalotrichum gorgonifer]|uniref:C3H1-type domain-containing protein n=1 Tax=Cephalotrichum gorgonifer TaxID=2041049 RepID=A0AAE8SRQ1_9PEZI|nr:uncharacterized protein DNG_00934 [Cephalotrichum gorgonifer]
MAPPSLQQAWPSLVPHAQSSPSSANSGSTPDSLIDAEPAFDDGAPRHTSYALHGEESGPGPFSPTSRDISHGMQRLNLLAQRAGVARGLEPSPIVFSAPRSMGDQSWAAQRHQVAMPAGYRNGGYDGADDGRQYARAVVGGGPAEDDLDEAYAYCYDRGNGEYTRLVPADMLPELRNIPARQRNRQGMVVLPMPAGRPYRGTCSNTCPIILTFGLTTLVSEPVAQDSSALHHHQRSSMDTRQAGTSASLQSRIDSIVKSAPPRRNKVFCDKWVHEGTCAFTQQGCKFRHEMPADRATQQAMGLFHGLPTWWKKHQAELQRQRSEPSSPTARSCPAAAEAEAGPIALSRCRLVGNHGRANPRPRKEAGGPSTPTPTASASASASRWGPIGPPAHRRQGLGAGQRGVGLAASRHNSPGGGGVFLQRTG